MTVSYNLDVSSVSFFNFFRVLFRWRGSVWKSVWSELMIWLIFYYFVMVTYRYALPEETRKTVTAYIIPLNQQLDNCVPLTFMLAFFVTVIVDRSIGAFFAAATLATRECRKLRADEHSRCFALISLNLTHSKEGKITAPPLFNAAWQEIKTFRSNMAILCNFDWVPIPLAYPQVIFVAVRFYFFMCLFTRQHLEPIEKKVGEQSKLSVDYYFPLLTVFQFIFFMGWMKVAEGLLNPLGEDDDDFECNFLIDKNISTGMSIVDETYDKHPEMRPDKFAEPAFAPFYPEQVIDSGADHALLGSAQAVTLAEPNDNIDMMKVDINSPIVVGKTETRASTLRRRLSSAFGKRTRSHSVQHASPEKLEPESPFSKSMAPQRPYAAFELSNGFASGGVNASQSHLPKLEEEDGTSSGDSDLIETETEATESVPHLHPVFVVPRTISEDANGPTSPILPFDTQVRGDLDKMKF
uniref:Bestrophin homolog n=1 Tax=Caenorhabditis japonica TaxID=281687 RepID=A0A8R1HW11_CAEJA